MIITNDMIDELLTDKTIPRENKFKLLNYKLVDSSVLEYLMDKLDNLYIEILGNYEGKLFELMEFGKLEGWCWQTTESAIVFLNDNDYIERGNLYFDERTPNYYHSWICFNFNDKEYVFDPSLNFICKKEDYNKAFKPDVKGKVTAKDVKDELIKQITTPKKEDNSESSKAFKAFWKNHLGEYYEEYQKRKEGEVIVHGPEDVNTPLYRNGAGYKTEIDNYNIPKIKKLTVHYYDCNC